MKIHITMSVNKVWFKNIYNLLYNSFLDLDYKLTDHTESEIVIAIQGFPSQMKKIEGKKYIVIQIEQESRPGFCAVDYYKFSDIQWGFNIDCKEEEYLVLGYHPCLEINCSVDKDVDVSFIGCSKSRKRRLHFFNNIKYKPKILNTWDFKQKIKNVKRSKINLNYHPYIETNFTEWDRICLMLANKTFILSEKFYCPLKINQFNSVDEYNGMAEYYLHHDKERQEIANSLYEEYRIKYDMRNILQEKLKCLKTK